MTTSPSLHTVLIVDDDLTLGRVLLAMLRQDGLDAQHVSSGDEALEVLARNPIDAVLTDLHMTGMDGMALLQRVRAQWPDIPVIMMTGHGTVSTAVEAMKSGAADFITKPFERAQIVFTIHKVLAVAATLEAPPRPDQPLVGGMVGVSAAMRESQELIQRAGQSNATVLIRGESGTGKELAARFIHQSSPRRAGPFVVVHCGALSEGLIASELFGYEKGAFTGATLRTPGRFEVARGGTIFLDEIGDVSPITQVSLLRVLQERAFQRVGSNETIKIDVRFVAATHRNLEEMIARGTFREDLFYRLNVVPIWMPPLRARPDDIDGLARHFCALHGAANGRPDATLDAGALAALREHPWPGNVRELQNLVEGLVVLAPSPRIGRADVEREFARRFVVDSSVRSQRQSSPPRAPTPTGADGGGKTLDEQRRETEREALVTALEKAKDNRTLAARLLGVSRRTLYNKLDEHKLS